MFFDIERVRDNAAKATTEDLLDRVTVYRAGMEPAALDVIEAELFRRGIGPREIDAHALSLEGAPRDADNMAFKCQRCERPAVWQGWVMHKLFGVLPIFPRHVARCAAHLNKT